MAANATGDKGAWDPGGHFYPRLVIRYYMDITDSTYRLITNLNT